MRPLNFTISLGARDVQLRGSVGPMFRLLTCWNIGSMRLGFTQDGGHASRMRSAASKPTLIVVITFSLGSIAR